MSQGFVSLVCRCNLLSYVLDNVHEHVSFLTTPKTIDHFSVSCLVAWPWNESEAGGDPVLIETSLLFSY